MPFTEGLLCNNGRAAILIFIFANFTLTTPMQGGSYAAQAFRDCGRPDAGAFVWRRCRACDCCCRGAAPGVASDATDIDKGLYTQQSFSGVLRSVQGVSFVNVTAEMKYFTKYESHGNYNQAFRMVTATTRWLLPVRPPLVAHSVYEAGLQLQPRKIQHAQGCD